MPSQERIKRLPPNHRGIDYIVGDIHGHFTVLESALSRLGFDRGRDRLLSVGDLVDRGPESHRAVDLLAQPWFFAVRGNHEQMMLDAVGGTRADPAGRALWYANGGGWFDRMSDAEAKPLLARIRELPYALAVELADGRQIGLVHADVPASSWPGSTAAITDARDRDAVLEHTVWSRKRAAAIHARLDGRRVRLDVNVGRIDRVFFGHTPMPAAIACGNTRWLDTGVFLPGGRLSIATAFDDALWSFAVDDTEDVERGWRTLD